jgi:hypothetical protein
MMDTNKKQISENEEVISPEIRVCPTEKEKHSVSKQNAFKYFPVLLYLYIRMSLIFYPYFFRILFLLSMQICGIMFASGMKMLMNSTSMIYIEDKNTFIDVEYV